MAVRRVPLWLTIVPLLLGGVVYWHFWSGWRDTLRTDLAAAMPGAAVTIGGFPYRLEADVAAPRYGLDGPIRLTVDAVRARANRTPWQRGLTVVRTEAPGVGIAVTDLPGVRVRATAVTSVSSINLGPGGIARLSTVLAALKATTGLFAAPVAADHFEVHLRETRARSNEAWSATPPQQAQVVLSGTGVRFGSGAPLTLAVDAGVTAASPLRTFAGWADGGTVEIRSAVLSDATGEVAQLVASAVPVAGTLRLTGTVTTVCPATVAAAVNGTAADAHAAPESRRRSPVRLAFGGTIGSFVLAPLPVDAPTTVRAQLPPCPRLS